MQTITLYYREGSSDKVYQAAIEPAAGGYHVHFAYGRRGSTLNTGTKSPVPVDLNTAQQTYEKLVREKRAKGYTDGPELSPYANSAQTATGIYPQLLNPTDAPEPLLNDNRFYLQPKHDGKRLLVQKRGTAVLGINRRGLTCGVPAPVVQSALAMPGDCLLDGEAVGETLHGLFDGATGVLQPA